MNFLNELGIKEINPGVCFGPDQWGEIDGATLIESINPATEQSIAKIATCDQTKYEKVMQNAQAAFAQWRIIPAPKRGELVRQIGQALREKKDLLGSLVALEMGKIKQEGDGEVQEMVDMADFAVGQSRMLYGKTMHSERPQHRMYEQWHPLGIVGVITAFNFPVAVWAWNAFIAAICGNVVVWKPSAKVSLCAIAVQQICNKVLTDNGYPAVFSLFVPDGDELKERFISDKRIALMSFTGSCAVGRHVHETVAKRMGKTLLELGGNNAIIVDESADLQLAVPAIVFGAVGTAGQRCTSTRRLIIHEGIYDRLAAQLINAYKQIPIGDPLEQNILMGPLIDAQAVTLYQRTLAELKESGGEILFGAKVLDRSGFFVEPTLVAAQNDWSIVQQETFAPILYLLKYKDIEEAVAIHNNVPQGLSSAIFTQNLYNAEYCLSAQGSDCGIANINIGTSGAEIGGAFGGEKETGGGRESGSDAWKAYMRRQTNTINWGRDLPLAQGIKFDLGVG
jgi:aldehyde dehydrogenase (NAD+)